MKRNVNHILSLSILAALLLMIACKKEEDVILPLQSKLIIKSSTPAEGTIGTELTIKGAGFQTGAAVLVGTINSNKIEIKGDTVIYALVPSGITANTSLAITVRNPDGGEASLPSAFMAVNPLLSFVNSATKPSGNIGSTVIIEGKAFGDVQGESQVLFSNSTGGTIAATIANAGDWTNTFIVTTVPQGATDGPIVVKTAIGTSNSLSFNITDAATFSPSAINWKLTTILPLAVSGHNAMALPIDDASNITHQYVFVSGGRDKAAQATNQVLIGKIGSNGAVSAWNTTTLLPEARSFHAQVAATPFNSKVKGSGFVYVLGGMNATGEPISTVSIASINNDGTVNAWNTTTQLPQALHSLGAVIFRGNIYIAGGATTGDVPVAKVYKASIDTLGRLGAWQELASLPSARSYHGFVSFGGFLYSVGGETGIVAPDNGNYQSNDTKLAEVAFAKIDIRTGALTTTGWTVNTNSLQKARSKHTTVVAGGNILVSSGLYSAAGQGSSENTYAQIMPDGTIGSFSGATGSNTLFSAGGNNLFNQVGISYIDANGVAHVMITGGDNVNTPGDKQADVLYY